MEGTEILNSSIDRRIAQRLKDLRLGRGWSLDDLAGRSGVSRATLSRLENSAISPTTGMLSKLCAAYGLTMSRLMPKRNSVRSAAQPATYSSVAMAMTFWTRPPRGDPI